MRGLLVMSRIGRQPVLIPSGVSVNVNDGVVSVSGSKGNLAQPLLEGLAVNIAGSISRFISVITIHLKFQSAGSCGFS